MITRIRAKNFKSWKDTEDVEFAPLTGFFGANSSGKSSLLQMLLLMKQTVESSDRSQILHTSGDARSYVDLGAYQDLIHGRQTDTTLEFSLSWKPTEASPSESIDFTTAIRVEPARAYVERFNYAFAPYYEVGMEKLSDIDKYKVCFRHLSGQKVQSAPTSSPIKFYQYPIYDKSVFQPDTSNSSPTVVGGDVSLERLLDSIKYLGPMRTIMERRYTWYGNAPNDVGKHGENTVPALLASKIGERIEGWLKELKLVESFSIAPISEERRLYEVRVRQTSESATVLIPDVGFGVSQVLPVLVLCYYVPEGSIIILEQPEIHLHPSVQGDLADVLIDVVKNRNVQVIVESHSEHLIHRLQRRIAEGALTSYQAALYFCQANDGVSSLERLELDEYGNIRNWPKWFFGDDVADLIAMSDAQMLRQSKRKRKN